MDYNEVTCSRCNRVPQTSFVTGQVFVTYICYPQCGNVFWTLRKCQSCKTFNYTKLISKPRAGEVIKCKKCNFACYYMHCPYPQCQALMYKQASIYEMGQATDCTECHQEFKFVVCPCGGDIYPDKDKVIFQGVTEFDCKICMKKVIYARCPECKEIDYFFQKQQIGDKIKCSHCKMARNFVPCPICGRSIYSKDFQFGEMQKCQFCKTSFEFSMCPSGCGILFQTSDTITGPYRTCKSSCGKVFVIINCDKCKHPLYIQDYQFGYSREQQCPACKKQIKFNLCQCGILSKNANRCQNPTCPAPKGIKNYSKQWKQKNLKTLQQKNIPVSEYNEKQCKLCYDLDSCMVNQVCRHMMMCQTCFRTVGQKQVGFGYLNAMVRCPICKRPGRYHKYVQPILQ